LSPLARRLLLIGIDALLLPLAVWLSFWLRLAHPLHPSFQAAGLWLLPAVLLLAGLGVMLCLPMPPRSERRRIVPELQRQAIPVLPIPSVDDLTSGRASIRVSKLPPNSHGAWRDRLPTRLSGRGCGGCGG